MNAEISFFQLVAIIRKRAFIIAGITFICTFAAYLISKTMTKTYQATATIMPMGGGGGMGGLSGGGASMPAVGSMLGFMGQGVSSSVRLGLFLESRTFSEKAARRLDLAKRLYPELWDASKGEWKVSDPSKIPTVEDAAGTLRGMISVKEETGKGIMYILVEAKDPNFAAVLANDVVAELRRYVQDNEFSDAKRNRLFIGRQLEIIRQELLESGKSLTQYYQPNKVSATIPEVTVDFGVNYATDPSGIDDLAGRADRLWAQKSEVDQNPAKLKTVLKVPQQVHFDYLTLKRGTLSQLNSMLTQQYEVAKIMESKEDVFFQVIDDAVAPTSIYKPKKRQMILSTFLGSMFLAVFTVIFAEYFGKNF